MATSAKALVSSETGPDSELARWGNLLSKDSVNLGMETDTALEIFTRTTHLSKLAATLRSAELEILTPYSLLLSHSA